jgi:hypothetical protein
VQGAHALGDLVAEAAGLIDDLVELAVQVAEVAADHVEHRLQALRQLL